MSKKITIQLITKRDCDLICQLNNEIFKDEVIYTKDYVQFYCEENKGYIAWVNGKPSGYIIYGYTYAEELKREVMTIVSIGVIEKYRRLGLGQRLLKKVLTKLTQYDIYLHVLTSNAPAIKLYEKEEFKIIMTVPKYYDLIKDGQQDAYTMEKKSTKKPKSK